MSNEQLVIVCLGVVFAILAWKGRRYQFFDAVFFLCLVLFMDCQNGQLSCRKEPRWFQHSGATNGR